MPIIYKINDPIHKKKMASFDYDWTLVRPKYRRKFPKNVDDWKWLSPNIPEMLQEYHKQDYMIVIFTNQSKEWKLDQLQNVMKTLEIPIFIVVGFHKSEHKPNPYMFHYLMNKYEINKEESFFVGDALGREHDYARSDLEFAEKIGIECKSPEEFFNLN
jgi:bifunctional polynucleotide phosphatase/kinase